MSYDSLEQSQQAGSPVLLYQFVRDSTTWRYVALPVAFSCGGNTWSPEAIASGSVHRSGDVMKDPLQVTLPVANELAATFLPSAPDKVTTLTVFRTHYDDPSNTVMHWKGRVLSTSATLGTFTLNCESIFASARRLGLHAVYQRACPHMLFGPGCYVDPTEHAQSISIAAVDRNTITLSGPTNGFVGGTVEAPDGTIRMIVGQNSDGRVLTLLRPVQSLIDSMAANPSGFVATMYLGCDKSVDMCRDRYHNLGNYGGFPGITGINPFAGTSNVFG